MTTKIAEQIAKNLDQATKDLDAEIAKEKGPMAQILKNYRGIVGRVAKDLRDLPTEAERPGKVA